MNVSGAKLIILSVLFVTLGTGVIQALAVIPLSPEQNTTEAGAGCSVSDAEYRPDGQFFVTTNGHAIIWDSTRLERVRMLSAWNNNIRTAEYSPDGQYIVTASDDIVEHT